MGVVGLSYWLFFSLSIRYNISFVCFYCVWVWWLGAAVGVSALCLVEAQNPPNQEEIMCCIRGNAPSVCLPFDLWTI